MQNFKTKRAVTSVTGTSMLGVSFQRKMCIRDRVSLLRELRVDFGPMAISLVILRTFSISLIKVSALDFDSSAGTSPVRSTLRL